MSSSDEISLLTSFLFVGILYSSVFLIDLGLQLMSVQEEIKHPVFVIAFFGMQNICWFVSVRGARKENDFVKEPALS